MQITKTIYVQAIKYSFEKSFKIQANGYKEITGDAVVAIDICEKVVTIDIPDFDVDNIAELHVEQLQKRLVIAKADTYILLTDMQQEIDDLLAIENK